MTRGHHSGCRWGLPTSSQTLVGEALIRAWLREVDIASTQSSRRDEVTRHVAIAIHWSMPVSVGTHRGWGPGLPVRRRPDREQRVEKLEGGVAIPSHGNHPGGVVPGSVSEAQGRVEAA